MWVSFTSSITALNIYLGGNAEISRKALSEFSHNMSYQALNKDNNNIFKQFDRTAELIIELISALLHKNSKNLNIANIINNIINDEINDYRFTFDIPTEIEIQQDMEEILKKQKKTANTACSLSSTTIINKEIYRD